MADVVTDRLVDRINWEPTIINSLTANTPAASARPSTSPPTASAWSASRPPWANST
jgi:hypothetical protein